MGWDVHPIQSLKHGDTCQAASGKLWKLRQVKDVVQGSSKLQVITEWGTQQQKFLSNKIINDSIQIKK